MTLTLCLILNHRILIGHQRVFQTITDIAPNSLSQTVLPLGFSTSLLAQLGREIYYSSILNCCFNYLTFIHLLRLDLQYCVFLTLNKRGGCTVE